MAATLPGRAWNGLTLLLRAFDDAHRATVEEVAWQHGLAIVALGHVVMHVRSRKPLQDVLSATRIGAPVAECGYRLAPNAEQHLRSRLRLANIYGPAALHETLRIARLCTFSLDELRYEYPDEVVPPGHTAASYLRKPGSARTGASATASRPGSRRRSSTSLSSFQRCATSTTS